MGEMQQEKVEKRQRRKLKKGIDNNVIPKTQLAKKQQQENWKKAKKNHNVIGYMHYGGQATDQSNEIHSLTLWCYYDSHGNTTRMSNNPRTKTENSTTPVTIVPAKTSLKYKNKRMRARFKSWLIDRRSRKHCLKILEVISEGDERDHMFQQQQEAQAAETEQWEKEKNEERQRQVQEKYQRLKQDREKQQQQKQKRKQRKKKQIQDDDDDDNTILTELTQESSVSNGEFGCHLIDDEDDKYDTNIVTTTTPVLFRMKNLNWKSKRNIKWKKEKYSMKVKMKQKITSMIVSVTNGYPTSDDDVSREYGNKGTLKMMDRRKLTKKKRMPNQWPDHPT